jgi:polar amino acid transport system substrate-binding protein
MRPTRYILSVLAGSILAVGTLVYAVPSRAQPTKCAVQAPADLVDPGHLTFGTVLGTPPQNFARNNEAAGFDIDVATALAGEMCLKPQFVNLAFAGLFPALNARKFDAVIAAVGITAQREESYDFVPYFVGGLRLVVRKDSGLFLTDESGVCGHTVAALAGSVEVRDLEKYKDSCPAGRKIDMRAFPSNNEILEQLRKNSVEIVFIDWPFAAYIVQQNAQDFAIGSPILTGEPPGEPRHREGIMVRKGDAGVKGALQQALARIQADGTYHKFLAKWNLQEGDIRKAQ